jgi:hypothetical protein
MSGVHAKSIYHVWLKNEVFYIACPVCMLRVYSCRVKHDVFYIACPVCMLRVYSCRVRHEVFIEQNVQCACYIMMGLKSATPYKFKRCRLSVNKTMALLHFETISWLGFII